MKFFVVALSLFAGAVAAPLYSDAGLAVRRKLPALEHEEIHDKYGQFALRYVTAEGTVVSERGRLVPNAEGTGYVMIIEGEYSYIGDDGQTYITKYTAGPDGYHVEGNHLPVPVTAEPVIAAEPVEVADEDIHVVAKPIQVEAVPVGEAVAEPRKVVIESVKVAAEPVEVAAEPVRVVAEPVKVVVEPLEAAAQSVAEPGRVIVQPIEFIVEPFVAERPH